ncbi:alpha/beta hydrolase [Streptomyces chiangmaiensis]|uniref:Alpha/beta hydrolase n=1 Tax=Streptomyces chiangmaiensis TaxID=766497 RepID=A0ABU7FQ59_9ACTN|nr:alpha/beta hydrolase [Streptomyces chiangmaiensis]MED7826081.1 alpha/beta hydrolase [Streptomyces chiangmaiensis]
MNRRYLYRRARTPLALMATATVAAALFAASIGPASAGKPSAPQQRKPTVVLVHGAFADSSSWNGVLKKLKREGYPVVAAAIPLRGLSSDAAYLKDLLAGIDGPVVLAAHSCGGAVISNAAHGADNVKALVYIAAFIPDKRERALALADKFPRSTLGSALHPVPISLPDGSKETDFHIDQDTFHHHFTADVPRNTADLMAVTQRRVTGAALGEPASESAWATVPSWALPAGKDLNIPSRTRFFVAERAKAHIVEVRASHAVSVSHPDDVADIIEKAARTVR